MHITDDYIETQRPALRQVPDLERALYVLQTWQKKSPESNPYKFMKEYMVRSEAVTWLTEHLMPKLKIRVVAEGRPESRKAKYAKLEKLALEKTFHEFTTQELVDTSGLGAQTITKWARSTGFFRSTGKGKWEARNPTEDRKFSGPRL